VEPDGEVSFVTDGPDSTLVSSQDDDRTRVVVRESLLQLQTGQVLRERFVIEAKLGEGGMGQVFLARDRQAEKSNPYVALKVLGASFKNHPQAYAALRREATQSRSLTHPNIVAVFDFDRTEDHVYMVMEYLKGHALDVIISGRPHGGKLTEVWPLIEGIARGLEYVHKKKIVHADVKPRNVFVTENGEIKVLDLGIARTLDESQASAGTTRFDPDTLGALTPQYASCEMFEGQTPKPQDDIFALGCITYELLTGQHPFQRRSALEARSLRLEPKRPPGLKKRQWKVLRASLAMQRADRPETVTEFIRGMSPERISGSPLPWIGAAAVLLGVIGVQVYRSYSVSDDQLIGQILEEYAVDPAMLADADDVAFWNEMSGKFHELGTQALRDGDLDRGMGLLVTTPSSAFNSYREIMTRSEDQALRRQAATGVLQLVREQRDAALSLGATPEQLEDKVNLVCTALKVMEEPGLRDAFDDLLRSDEAAVRGNRRCLDVLDRIAVN